MQVDLGPFGVWRRVSEITPEMATQVEQLGYTAIWIGGSPAGHLEDVERVLDATVQIPVITGIVNMWREDAVTVGESCLRLTAKHPDRFLLGVGIGHPETTGEYTRPLIKINEYLDQLYDVGVPRDGLVLAALGPKVLHLSAQRTAGAHPYLTTPRHTKLARGVLGEGPLLAPEHKVILETNPARARAVARLALHRYLRLVNYGNNLLLEGWTEADLADDGSDRLIDALVLHGDVEEIASGLQAHISAGADHVGIQALGDDPIAEYRELATVLFA